MRTITLVVHVKDGYEGIADLMEDTAWIAGVGVVLNVDSVDEQTPDDEADAIEANYKARKARLIPDPEANSYAGQHPSFGVFYIDEAEKARLIKELQDAGCHHEAACVEIGWHWWSCQPGCLPDSEPCGPFDTSKEAYEDALGEDDPLGDHHGRNK